jgi:hypothetical protein
MGEFGDHEDPPGFTGPLAHHLDDPDGGSFVGSPDGDVFIVEVERDFTHVRCETDHTPGESCV